MAKEFNLMKVLGKVDDVVRELKNNDEMRAKFKDEPVKTIEEMTGLDLPDEKVEKVIDLIEAKIDDADVDEKLAASAFSGSKVTMNDSNISRLIAFIENFLKRNSPLFLFFLSFTSDKETKS